MKYYFYKGIIPSLCWLFITVTQFSANNVRAKDIDVDTEIAYLSAYNYAENYLSKTQWLFLCVQNLLSWHKNTNHKLPGKPGTCYNREWRTQFIFL